MSVANKLQAASTAVLQQHMLNKTELTVCVAVGSGLHQWAAGMSCQLAEHKKKNNTTNLGSNAGFNTHTVKVCVCECAGTAC